MLSDSIKTGCCHEPFSRARGCFTWPNSVMSNGFTYLCRIITNMENVKPWVPRWIFWRKFLLLRPLKCSFVITDKVLCSLSFRLQGSLFKCICTHYSNHRSLHCMLWINLLLIFNTVCCSGIIPKLQRTLPVCVGVFTLVVFSPQDLLIAPTRLAAAKPVWPVWTEDRGATQSPPSSALWDWGQPRSRQSSIWWPSYCQGDISYFFIHVLSTNCC